jgi:hypothetical protein
MGAISLSGQFKVKEVVPELIQLLEKRAITRMDFDVKAQIIRVLGQIGDSRAINSLRGIISSEPLLFKNSFIKLKGEVSTSLKNYPLEKVKDLMNHSSDSEWVLRNLEKRNVQIKWLYITVAAALTVLFVAKLPFLTVAKKPYQYPATVITKEMKTDRLKAKLNNNVLENLSVKDTTQKEAESSINLTNKNLIKPSIDNEHGIYRTIYSIQTGTFKNKTYARDQYNSLMKLLDKKELDYLRIESINTFNVVRIGKFEGYSTAVKLIKDIKPHISRAFILETYINNDNIIKIYKKSSLSSSKIN